MSELLSTYSEKSFLHDVLGCRDFESRLESREGAYLFRESDVKAGIFIISYVKTVPPQDSQQEWKVHQTDSGGSCWHSSGCHCLLRQLSSSSSPSQPTGWGMTSAQHRKSTFAGSIFLSGSSLRRLASTPSTWVTVPMAGGFKEPRSDPH